MESVFDIINEAKRDDFIEQFKKRTIMETERDVHVAFEIYGRDGVVDMVYRDIIAFHLGDRKIIRAECEMEVCEDSETAYDCMFGDGNSYFYVSKLIGEKIDELISDYEVQL